MAERIDVHANEILIANETVFSFGKSEKPKKYTSINIDGKPVKITKGDNGKYSFIGEGVEKINFLDSPDSAISKDKVNVFAGNLESMTIRQGNYTTPTRITYKPADNKTN